MKKDIIYISCRNKEFEAKAKTRFNMTIALSTNDIQGVLYCIKSVSNSIWLLKDYGKKAIPLISGKMEYIEFVKLIGGREKLKIHNTRFPIELE